VGEIMYRRGKEKNLLTCFWGFCEVLPDRVGILAELGERAEDIDPARAEAARDQAAARLKAVRDEAGFKEAQVAYTRAVTRLSVSRRCGSRLFLRPVVPRYRAATVLTQLRTLLRYRLLIQSLVVRELKARYRGSVLGFFWSFINPLLQLLTYGLVFTVILPVQHSPVMEPYLLFFFCGILPWTAFQSALAESSGVLIAGGNLIKKVLFPAEVLTVVTVLSNLVQFLFGLPVLLLFLACYGRLSPWALLLPLPLLVQLIFTLGLALGISALTVHFRDIQSILAHLLHLWFFASPILYYYGDVTGWAHTLLRFNPMTHILVSYQEILFHGHFNHGRALLIALGVALLCYALGASCSSALRDTLAEEV
jgi:ABC-type polysaccharide/polyol phosphate export permease